MRATIIEQLPTQTTVSKGRNRFKYTYLCQCSMCTDKYVSSKQQLQIKSTCTKCSMKTRKQSKKGEPKSLKPLNPTDYKMKFIKDCGMSKELGKAAIRKVQLQCSECGNINEYRSNSMKGRDQKVCITCSYAHKVTASDTGSKHPLYSIWKHQKKRCSDSNNVNYGGRGIILATEFHSFNVWLDYVQTLENLNIEDATLDRIDNDLGYIKGNMRWADKSIQAQNKQNKSAVNNNTTGVLGIYKDKRYSGSGYMVKIQAHSTIHNLGTFNTLDEAKKVRNNFINVNHLEHPTC